MKMGNGNYPILVPRDNPARCERCSGTGRFVRGCLNGKPAGPGGECFRCKGKGFVTSADEKRNTYYDIHNMGRTV